MSTVCFYTTHAEIYRPVIVEREEIFSSPTIMYETERCRFRRPGPYDVAEELAKLPAPFNNPSLVLVMLDLEAPATGLHKVKCPKVLFPGDTHHGIRPIERRVRYCLSEPFDLVVLEFRASHCHWFSEAGVRGVASIPCFNINPRNIVPRRARVRGISFVGQVGALHPRRAFVLEELRRRGYPVMVCQTDQMSAAKIYNESAVSLNISLNGDFNLRNWEIAAAGGLCVGDSPWETGVAEARRVTEYCLKIDAVMGGDDGFTHQVDAYSLAKENHTHFWAEHSPEMQVKRLRFAITEARAMADIDPRIFEHIAAYEALQEQQRLHVADEPLKVTVHDKQTLRDASDLSRLDVGYVPI